MDKSVSNTINHTKFILILLVVALHSVTRSDLWTLETLTGSMYAYKAIRIIIGNILGTLAIPMFFFFSGYLYFHNISEFTKEIFWHKTTRRITSLLVPYLLWNVIAAIYFVLQHHHGAWTLESILQSLGRIDGWHIFWDVHKGSQPRPADFPLWYMRDLLILCLTTPGIYFLNKYAKWYWMPLLWFITCVVYPLPYITGFGFVYFIVFALGCYWGQYKKTLIANNTVLGITIGISIILIAVIFAFRHETYTTWLRTLFTITGSIALLRIVYTACKHHWLKDGWHIQSTFFIYAIHIIGIRTLSDKCFTHLLPYSSQNGYYLLLRFFLAIGLTVIISMLLYRTLKIICPKALKILCGR